MTFLSAQCFNPFQGMGLVDLVAQGIQARKTDHRHHGIFQVDFPGMFGGAAAQVDVAKQAERRFEHQRILGEMMKESRFIQQGGVNVPAQFMGQFGISVNRAEIKENAEVDDFLRLRLVNPLVETGNPIGQGAAPARIAGHHLPAAERVSGAIQAITHPRSQAQEIIVTCFGSASAAGAKMMPLS